MQKMLRTLKPKLNDGDFVFCVVKDVSKLNASDVMMSFREDEGVTVIIRKEIADQMKLEYSFVASWITLTVHSSLEAVGLTAAFAKALSDEGISCNVVAAFYHDHIFVDSKKSWKAVDILKQLSKSQMTD